VTGNKALVVIGITSALGMPIPRQRRAVAVPIRELWSRAAWTGSIPSTTPTSSAIRLQRDHMDSSRGKTAFGACNPVAGAEALAT
jgi:hypothetical protein